MATNNLKTDLWEFTPPATHPVTLKTDLWEFVPPATHPVTLKTDVFDVVFDSFIPQVMFF